MVSIENYEEYCRAFSGDSRWKARAELLLHIQDWMIRLAGENDDFFPLSDLLERNADRSALRDAKQDSVAKIVSECDSAVRRIASNMRENIVRENVRLPVYQVKEVNSYGLNWLSRRPGRTIREKISNSTSLMAVKRRMSFDSGENRLYMAFLRELGEILETKNKFLPENLMTDVEKEFWSFISSVLYSDELDEIGRWENMPPNNTLLSDQFYKKVWKGWEALKGLDRYIKGCNAGISDRLCEMLYIEFLTRARGVFRIPQVPTLIDYENYAISIESPIFYLIDIDNEKLAVERRDGGLHVEYKEKAVDVAFSENIASIASETGQRTLFELSAGRIPTMVGLLFTKIGIRADGTASRKVIEKKSFDSVTMDLFGLYPEYISGSGEAVGLRGRLAMQNFGRYALPCDDANAVIVQSEQMVPYTIQSAVINNSLPQLGQLMHLLEDQVVTNDFTFVFPDAFDEFQLSLVHKAARMAYRNVRSFPRSIGIAFDCQDSERFLDRFRCGDFLFIVDIVDDDVVFTLVQGIAAEDVRRDYPKYHGYIWERHPSLSYPVGDELKNLYDSLKSVGFSRYAGKLFEAFGLDGILEEENRLSVIYDNDLWFSIDSRVSGIIKRVKVNISDKVHRFLLDHGELIGKSRVHIVSLSDSIFYKGTCSFERVKRERALAGFKGYEKQQKHTETLLWRDHLPELGIKQLYGKFMLVDKETITPKFNVKKKIAIDGDFTLPANGKTEYRFSLVQSNSNKKTKFMAVVRSPAFPLSEDACCRLDMTYEYGAENPYVLFFRPKDKGNPKFIEAKVTWEKISEYPMYHLPYPEFMPERSWEELKKFKGIRGTEDLIHGPKGLIKRFEKIQAGYSTMDLSNRKDIRPRKDKNGRIFTIDAEIDSGEPVRIIFSEKHLEGYKEEETKAFFERPGKVSFELSEEKQNERYQVYLPQLVTNGGPMWVKLKGGRACFIEMTVKEINPYCPITIALFENQFDHPEDFHERISRVSFEISSYKGKYTAQKIHDEDSGAYQKTYWALQIRKGDRPESSVYDGRAYFLMHTVFSGRKSIYDAGCPSEFKRVFQDTAEAWKELYSRCDDGYVKSRIFGLMSLAGADMGTVYYAIAGENVRSYLADAKCRLNDYIGYALGDYTLPEEKELLGEILRLPDRKIICILSKAVWGNPDFIWNLPIDITLKYFDLAISRAGELLRSKTPKAGKDMAMCFEYILAVYRLRERYGESEEVMRRLSQNNRRVQKLYEYVEETIDRIRDNMIEIKCYLDLRITNKGLYERIPNLLYALLVYVTGNAEAGDIRIAGLSMEDLEV